MENLTEMTDTELQKLWKTLCRANMYYQAAEGIQYARETEERNEVRYKLQTVADELRERKELADLEDTPALLKPQAS